MWIWENPCTSFSDYSLLNGGTRTFDHPKGDGSREIERDGNAFAELMCEACIRLHDTGKVFIFENQAASGRYVKVYDLPCFQRLLTRTKAAILPGSMCAWGLRPSDASDAITYYRKNYWLVVSPRLLPHALILRHRCPGLGPDHQHAVLQGNVPGTSINRTQEAAEYPWDFACAVARVIRDATIPPTHPKAAPVPPGRPGCTQNKTGQGGRGGSLPQTEQEAGTQEAAESYRDLCAGQEKFTKEAMAKAALLGDRLVKTAGSWGAAVRGLRDAWQERFGHNLEGVAGNELEGLVSQDLLDYLKEVTKDGVPTRQPRASARVAAQPHRSLLEHLEEAMQKLWKDCHRGRVLLCTEAANPHLEGVVSSPWGRVPKLNPDRTVSQEGRMIHDQRLVNATGHKHAPLPRLATAEPCLGARSAVVEGTPPGRGCEDGQAGHRRGLPLDLAQSRGRWALRDGNPG